MGARSSLKILLSLLIFSGFLTTAVKSDRPVVLSCDRDDDVIEEIEQTRLEQGFPGKAGARGPQGWRKSVLFFMVLSHLRK